MVDLILFFLLIVIMCLMLIIVFLINCIVKLTIEKHEAKISVSEEPIEVNAEDEVMTIGTSTIKVKDLPNILDEWMNGKVE